MVRSGMAAGTHEHHQVHSQGTSCHHQGDRCRPPEKKQLFSSWQHGTTLGHQDREPRG